MYRTFAVKKARLERLLVQLRSPKSTLLSFALNYNHWLWHVKLLLLIRILNQSGPIDVVWLCDSQSNFSKITTSCMANTSEYANTKGLYKKPSNNPFANIIPHESPDCFLPDPQMDSSSTWLHYIRSAKCQHRSELPTILASNVFSILVRPLLPTSSDLMQSDERLSEFALKETSSRNIHDHTAFCDNTIYPSFTRLDWRIRTSFCAEMGS